MADTKTALITGASGGIGLELAKIFASNGINLIIVSRKVIELAKLGTELSAKHGIFVEELEKDLSIPGIAKEIFNEVNSQSFNVDYLVNNAGFGDFGLFQESDWSKQERMINVNMLALTHLTRLFLPSMVKKRSGKILKRGFHSRFPAGTADVGYYTQQKLT